MSRIKVDILETLNVQCHQLLEEVRSGNQADFLRFTEQFDELYGALPDTFDVEALSNDELMRLRAALRELERTRQTLMRELAGHKSEVVDRLAGMQKGKQGLEAYRSTIQGPASKTKRGSG